MKEIYATFWIDVLHNLFFRRKESVPLEVLDLQKKESKAIIKRLIALKTILRNLLKTNPKHLKINIYSPVLRTFFNDHSQNHFLATWPSIGKLSYSGFILIQVIWENWISKFWVFQNLRRECFWPYWVTQAVASFRCPEKLLVKFKQQLFLIGC